MTLTDQRKGKAMRTSPLPKPRGRPPKTYSQARRLIGLYDALRRGGRLRLQEVADELGLGIRTLQRDVVVLQDLLKGLIRHDASESGGGVEYELPHAAGQWKVEGAQLLALAVGANMTAFLSGPHFVTKVRPLLDQLAGSLQHGQRQRLTHLEDKVVVLEPGRKHYQDQPEAQERLGVMVQGLQRQKPVDVVYLSHERRKAGHPARHLRAKDPTHLRNHAYRCNVRASPRRFAPPLSMLTRGRLNAARQGDIERGPPTNAPSPCRTKCLFYKHLASRERGGAERRRG